MSVKRKILIVTANPKDTARLRVDKEVREIDEGLLRSRKRDVFDLEQKWAVRIADLRRALLDYNPQIVHFSGHGEVDGIMVEDDSGNARLVDPQGLAGLFKLFKKQVECVLLNACYSEMQAKAINEHIDYVIGMNKRIGDEAAIEFAIGFYDALGAGRPYNEAFEFGCNAIQLHGIPEHLTPVLLVKAGASEMQVRKGQPGSRVGQLLSDLPDERSVVKPHWEEEKLQERKPQEKEFAFEKVRVNDRGEVTHREHRTAQQFLKNLGSGIVLEMVAIPGGTFLMGSLEVEKGHENDETPRHEVTIAPFYMSKYLVTQEQWTVVMGENPSYFKGVKRPVEQISWNDAMRFCDQLSNKTGHTYRLPSEAEWEYACRAETTTPFSFGETITTELANYDGVEVYASEPKGKYREETTEVDNFPPNAVGLYDMHGNVWEWCADPWHDNYVGAPSDGWTWEERGDSNLRVLRGGSWDDLPGALRCAKRRWTWPGDKNYLIGIRLVCVRST